jgi:FMN phosphatase YigB (HAD superfamily)
VQILSARVRSSIPGGVLLRAAVLDLDHTLFDPHTLPRATFLRLETRVRQLAAGVVSERTLEAALADAWRSPFDSVVKLHALPEALTTAWRDAACALEVTEPLIPFPDVVDGLQQLSLRRFLLTTGFRRFQESKVRQLGLACLFEAVYVDALDPPGPLGKRALLERLLREHALKASEVIVVGDRADDELSAGAALGMVVVQVLRPGVVPDRGIALQIPDLAGLPALVAQLP